MVRKKVVAASLIGLFACCKTPAKWNYGETKDAMTDKVRARSFADGPDGAIGFKCDEPGAQSLYVQFVSKRYLGGDGARFGARGLVFRFDGRTPVVAPAAYDGSNAIIVDHKFVTIFFEQLRDAQKLAVRATTYDNNTVDASFDVVGAAAEMLHVADTCKATTP